MGTPDDAEHRKTCFICAMRWAAVEFVERNKLSSVRADADGLEAAAKLAASALHGFPKERRQEALDMFVEIVWEELVDLDVEFPSRSTAH